MRSHTEAQRQGGIEGYMKFYPEFRIIEAVRKLLENHVNKILGSFEYQIPLIEFSSGYSGSVINPLISLTTCERTEKERIIRQDAYNITINFNIPETPESELHCYVYSGAVSKAIYDNPTLDGIADKTVITGKKYTSPKTPNCGEVWELVIRLRVKLENAQLYRQKQGVI